MNKVKEIKSEEYELIKQTVAKGSSDSEFKLLIHVANKYQLDPLLKEIWCIKRNQNDVALIMTGRDGYLTIAHRSGQLDGMQHGITRDEKGAIVSAWCEVWRKDMGHSFKSEVYYSEYKKNSPTWNQYPSAMLIKVAEVFALKRAFSISGMVTQEEMEGEPERLVPAEWNVNQDGDLNLTAPMDQAFNERLARENDKEAEVLDLRKASDEKITKKMIARLVILLKETSGEEKYELNKKKLKIQNNVEHLSELTIEQGNAVIHRLVNYTNEKAIKELKKMVASTDIVRDVLSSIIKTKFGNSISWSGKDYEDVILFLQNLKPDDIEDWKEKAKI